jgi:hypothetical protein
LWHGVEKCSFGITLYFDSHHVCIWKKCFCVQSLQHNLQPCDEQTLGNMQAVLHENMSTVCSKPLDFRITQHNEPNPMKYIHMMS